MDNLKRAQQKYAEKRVTKSVSFNLEIEHDLFEYSRKLDFSNWVKAKIRGDMETDKYRKDLEKTLDE